MPATIAPVHSDLWAGAFAQCSPVGTTPAQTVVIAAIAGTAGTGKTSLAVRRAHRVRGHFLDGRLYVDLRGYDPGPAVTSEQARDGFLRAMDVPGEAIPHDVDAMAAVDQRCGAMNASLLPPMVRNDAFIAFSGVPGVGFHCGHLRRST